MSDAFIEGGNPVRRVSHALPPVAAILALASSVLAAPTAGSKAPELTVQDLNGKPFHLSQYRGKSPVLLNFFSVT
jgi:hypothetical protein